MTVTAGSIGVTISSADSSEVMSAPDWTANAGVATHFHRSSPGALFGGGKWKDTVDTTALANAVGWRWFTASL